MGREGGGRTFELAVGEGQALRHPVALAVLPEEVRRIAEQPRRQHDVAPSDLQLRELLREVRVRPAQHTARHVSVAAA